MRKRQTVFGDQLQRGAKPKPPTPQQVPNAPVAQLLAPPRVGAQMRRFSRLSSMKPQPLALSVPEEAGDASSMHSVGSTLDVDPALTAPDFDPRAYLESAAQHADATYILQFADRLRGQLQKIADSESQSLQSNQHALITLATDVGKMAGVVAELHKEVAELSLVTDAMRQDASTRQTVLAPTDDPEAAEDTANRRQSMLALNSLWAQDLQSLYARVEGAQKLIPAAPGRHVALEENGWLEMNLLTQQSVKPVLIILLNDYLIVASSHSGKYVVDEHWRLDGQLSLDIDEDHKVLSVALGAHAKGLLAPSLARLRKVYGELCKLCEIASNTAPFKPARASQQFKDRRASHTPLQPSHAPRPSQTSLADVSPETRREVGRVLAELDSLVAYRQWSNAVDLYLQHVGDSAFAESLEERGARLVALLQQELASLRPRSKAESISLLNLLTRLGHAKEARHTLLDTAAKDIDAQQRSVHFMGDVVNYISQMAAIYFQTIIATVEVYRTAFPAETDSSMVVAWAKTQVDIYASVFNRQLFRIAPELKGYQKCREVSRLESSQLKSLRMEMEFMLRYVWEQ